MEAIKDIVEYNRSLFYVSFIRYNSLCETQTKERHAKNCG